MLIWIHFLISFSFYIFLISFIYRRCVADHWNSFNMNLNSILILVFYLFIYISHFFFLRHLNKEEKKNDSPDSPNLIRGILIRFVSLCVDVNHECAWRFYLSFSISDNDLWIRIDLKWFKLRKNSFHFEGNKNAYYDNCFYCK